jgi:uncharacterized protein YunC (DUF1805 family)
VQKLDPDTGIPLLKNGEPVTEMVAYSVPNYKTVPVFDISQTSGKEFPELAVNLEGNIENCKAFFKALKEISPVPIVFEEIADGSNGYFSATEGKIGINKGMSELQSFKTMVHEIAHAKLHVNNSDNNSVRNNEIIAESVAYVVCRQYGLDTSDYSLEYIAGWSLGKGLEELKSSLETIKMTASDIIKQIDEQLGVTEIAQEKPIESGVLTSETRNIPENNGTVYQDKPFGNTPYYAISVKVYTNVDNEIVDKVRAKLESQSVKFSGKKRDNNKTTFTTSPDDVDKLKAIIVQIKGDITHEKPPRERVKSGGVIGNTPFNSIIDKQFRKHTIEEAAKIVTALESQGVNFSGKIGVVTTTLTIEKVDIPRYESACRSVGVKPFDTSLNAKLADSKARADEYNAGRNKPQVAKKKEVEL